MALPTQKHTQSRKRIRRAALRQKPIDLNVCPECRRAIKPHQACGFCGMYRGKRVLKIKFKKGERKKKIKEPKKE